MIIVNSGFVKTQKLSEGSKLAKLDSHHLKEKMNEVNKKEEKLAGSLKKLEETNIKSAVQLQKDLHNELEKVSKYFYFPESLFLHFCIGISLFLSSIQSVQFLLLILKCRLPILEFYHSFIFFYIKDHRQTK